MNESCKQTSKPTSEWSSIYIPILGCSEPLRGVNLECLPLKHRRVHCIIASRSEPGMPTIETSLAIAILFSVFRRKSSLLFFPSFHYISFVRSSVIPSVQHRRFSKDVFLVSLVILSVVAGLKVISTTTSS